jgi:hypothetical protein
LAAKIVAVHEMLDSMRVAHQFGGAVAPRISYFYGIVVSIYSSDHPPPHFHARYGEYEAKIDIDTGELH